MPKRIIFPEKDKVALVKHDLPAMGAEDIKIKTIHSLISIGTETTILKQNYDPDTHFGKMFSFPQLKTGVQAVGEIIEVGSAVKDFQLGDTIYMREAHGSHQVLLAKDCSPVPDGLDLKAISWCGLAKTAFRAAWAGEFESADNVLIVGVGPLGQMLVRWAKSYGVDDIAVVDFSQQRLALAQKGGANKTYQKSIVDCAQELRLMNNKQGPGLIVDVTGNAMVFQHALGIAARFGKVILLGDTGYPAQQCLTSDVMVKGLTIQATHESHDRNGWTERRVDEHFFSMVKEQCFDLSNLITHEFSPTDCVEAYRIAVEERESALGILFDWSNGEW